MKAVTFRLDDEVYNELSELAETFDKSMNMMIQDCVRSVYDKFNGDPKAKFAVEQLRDLSNILQEMASKLNSYDGETKSAESEKSSLDTIETTGR